MFVLVHFHYSKQVRSRSWALLVSSCYNLLQHLQEHYMHLCSLGWRQTRPIFEARSWFPRKIVCFRMLASMYQCFCCQLDRCQELIVWINSLLLPSLVSQETCVVKTKRSTCKSNIELFWMIYQEINRRIWCYTISLKISCQLLGVVMDHFLACYEN